MQESPSNITSPPDSSSITINITSLGDSKLPTVTNDTLESDDGRPQEKGEMTELVKDWVKRKWEAKEDVKALEIRRELGDDPATFLEMSRRGLHLHVRSQDPADKTDRPPVSSAAELYSVFLRGLLPSYLAPGEQITWILGCEAARQVQPDATAKDMEREWFAIH